jgi:hypothetical protein
MERDRRGSGGGEARRRLEGKTVDGVEISSDRMEIRFTDGSLCEIRVERGALVLSVPKADPDGPTLRQREYLRFIQSYMDRYRVAPSESRIAKHFLVAPPSAHQMVVALEKRGFIVRTPGEARSIRFADPAVRW